MNAEATSFYDRYLDTEPATYGCDNIRFVFKLFDDWGL
jgi:hypothetical protein